MEFQGIHLKKDKRQLLQAGLIGAITLVVIVAYVLLPTTANGSVAGWLVTYWNASEDYSHGFLVPFITVFLLVLKFKDLPERKSDMALLGAMVILAAIALYWVGIRAQRPHFAAFSFIVLMFGFLFFFGGWAVTKVAAFPVAFLFFMVPMGFFLEPLTFELRLIVSVVATFFLNAVGIHTVRVGTSINPVPTDPTAALEVADPCSGIRSLVMLTALASLYGYLTLNKPWKKWLLFAAAAPLAVTANVVRIATIAMISRVFGTQSALHIYDKWSGLIVFCVAVISVVGASALLSMNFRQLIRGWLKETDTKTRHAFLQQTAHK